MTESGFRDDLPEDVMKMHEAVARDLANLWANGSDGARVCIQAALCRETVRMAKGFPAALVLAPRPLDDLPY